MYYTTATVNNVKASEINCVYDIICYNGLEVALRKKKLYVNLQYGKKKN